MALRNTKINLSINQQKRLLRGMRSGNGLNMRISAVNMRGNLPIKITQAQMRKMDAARRASRGMMVKFSARQMREMATPTVQGGIAPLLGLLLAGVGGLIAGAANIIGRKLAKKAIGKGHASSGPQSGSFLPRVSNRARTATPRNLPFTSPILRPGNIFEPDPRDIKFKGATAKAKKKKVRRGVLFPNINIGVKNHGLGLVPLGTGHIPTNLPRRRQSGFGISPLGVTPRRGGRRGPLSGAGLQLLRSNPRGAKTRGSRNRAITPNTRRGGQSAIQQLIASLPTLTATQKKRFAR